VLLKVLVLIFSFQGMESPQQETRSLIMLGELSL